MKPNGNSTKNSTQVSYYEILGTAKSSTAAELKAAYRQKARELHPDTAGPQSSAAMIRLNEAWATLADAEKRKRYDQNLELKRVSKAANIRRTPQPGATTAPSLTRRQYWLAGVQSQMARLVRLAGRSAVQGILVKGSTSPRESYEALLDELVADLTCDVEQRVRAARAAGAAPLDLAVAAVLVGIRLQTDSFKRQASLSVEPSLVIKAELLDRMWDIVAHEIPVQLTNSLGGNPNVRNLLRM